jgi:hypothetical protein
MVAHKVNYIRPGSFLKAPVLSRKLFTYLYSELTAQRLIKHQARLKIKH